MDGISVGLQYHIAMALFDLLDIINKTTAKATDEIASSIKVKEKHLLKAVTLPFDRTLPSYLQYLPISQPQPSLVELGERFICNSKERYETQCKKLVCNAFDKPKTTHAADLKEVDIENLHGTYYLEQFRSYLDNFLCLRNAKNKNFFALSEDQSYILQSCLAASAQILFKEDAFVPWGNIASQQGWNHPETSSLLIQMPRRFGKSLIIALYSFLIALSSPRLKICIISTCLRISNLMLETIREISNVFTLHDPLFPFRIDGNKSSIVIRMKETPLHSSDIRNTIFSVPCTAATTRGISADILIIDEMAYIKVPMIKETIAALTQMRQCCIIGISTYAGPQNFFTKLMRYPDPHDKTQTLFGVYTVQSACVDCTERETTATCTHTKFTRPHWLKTIDNDVAKALFLGDELLEKQETEGVITSKTNTIFNYNDVECLFTEHRHFKWEKACLPCIWVYIDPNGGGNASRLAILAITWIRDNLILLGSSLDFTKSRKAVQNTLIRFLDQLTANFPGALLIMVIENNLAFEADSMCTIDLLEYQKVNPSLNMVYAGSEIKYGICLTNEIKKTSVSEAVNLLENRRVYIYENFITIHPQGSEYILECCRNELLAFQSYSNVLSTASNVTIRYSGKNNGGTDDWVIVFLMACYWTKRSFKYSLPLKKQDLFRIKPYLRSQLSTY